MCGAEPHWNALADRVGLEKDVNGFRKHVAVMHKAAEESFVVQMWRCTAMFTACRVSYAPSNSGSYVIHKT